ncbi:hypothetical protein DPMN_194640, partial [Dreissena polymorpha]
IDIGKWSEYRQIWRTTSRRLSDEKSLPHQSLPLNYVTMRGASVRQRDTAS